jgi:hypothetical protein
MNTDQQRGQVYPTYPTLLVPMILSGLLSHILAEKGKPSIELGVSMPDFKMAVRSLRHLLLEKQQLVNGGFEG